MVDAFQSTKATWIGVKLAEGATGREAINRHVMEVYREPLGIYFLGTSDRRFGEADEVVEGFFASRLGRSDFLDKWASSGKPLRRWLMNAFCFYLKERRRERERSDLVGRGGEVSDDLEDRVPGPEESIDRAFATSIMRRALEEAQEACVSRGLTAHWGAFIDHYLDGDSYRRIAEKLAVTEDRACVMARTVRRRFVKVVRSLFDREGVSRDRIDEEIRSLLEVIGA